MLTGESEDGAVNPGAMLLAGTLAVKGGSRARVTAVGPARCLAWIARLTTAVTKLDAPPTRGLRGVVRLTATIAISVVASGSEVVEEFVEQRLVLRRCQALPVQARRYRPARQASGRRGRRWTCRYEPWPTGFPPARCLA